MNGSTTRWLPRISHLLFVLGSVLPASAGATFSQFDRTDLAVGNQSSVAIADFDRDGDRDLAMVQSGSNVTVLLGNGNGGFGPQAAYPTGLTFVESVVAADVNGDSNPDLLAGHVAVLLGAGDGTFGPPMVFGTGAGDFLRVADFNNDGRLDVAASAPALVRLGNGDGTFGPQMNLSVTGCAVSDLMSADFNEDGRADLAFLNPCPFGKVSILLGNGDGTFQPQNDVPVPSSPWFGDTGDLNGDGHADIVVSNSQTNLSVLLGNGDGTFLPRTDIEIGWDPAGVKIADLNSDGDPDVAVTSHGTHAVYLLAGRGDGTFEPKLGFATAPFPYSLQVGDMRTDGLLDLVTPVVNVAPPVGGLTLLLNSSGPPAGSAPVVAAPAVVHATEGVAATFTVTASDPDGDRVDLLKDDVTLAGRTFTVNSQSTSGTYTWTPSFGTARPEPYNVVFTARNELVGQAITRIQVSRPVTPNAPVLAQPADMTVDETTIQNQTLTATDADGDALTFSKTAGPPFMTVTTVTPGTGTATGNIRVAPGSSDAGVYAATVRATDYGLYDEKSLTITVNDVPGAPTLAPIANMTVVAGSTADQAISATDSDGDAITFSFTGPFFMTVTSDEQVGTTRTGNIHVAAPFFQSGLYLAAVTANSNGQADSRSFTIEVRQRTDRAPVVTAPSSVSGSTGSLITFQVSASDPDGDAIASLTASNVPSGATFTSNAARTSGTFSWTPTSSQAGSYSVTFTASNALSGAAATSISVGAQSPPVVTAPSTPSGSEGMPLTFTVSAADADGSGIVSLTASPLPAGATFSVNASNTSGTFDWTPTFAQAGTYPVTFQATSGNGGSGSATSFIIVGDVDRPPVADAGPDRTGVVNVPVVFDGSPSSDPDGNALTYSWDFGDGVTGSGVTPSHAYTAIGTYTVALTVSASGLADTDNTLATILEAFPATAFTVGGNQTTSLSSGKPYTCVQIQPDGGYANADVILASIRMEYSGGAVTRIFADAAKTTVQADKNHDEIEEIVACFRKEDLRLLFSALPSGPNTVQVDIRGDLVSGGGFRATLSMTVKGSGGSLAAAIAPNPLNPRAKLTFATSKAGGVRVQMFDLGGRLVRTIEDRVVGAGWHELDIDGRTSSGSRVASGTYLV